MTKDLCKVALVIPVHNRRDTTLQCLRSLARIDSTGLDVKLFIVDDGSTDDTSAAIHEAFPEVVLLTGDGSLHYAAGTNFGIKEALKWKPHFFVLMNDDAVCHDQFLQRLINTARSKPRSVVGALLLLWDEPHRVFQVDLKWNTWKGGWQHPTEMTAFDFPKEPFDVECLVGNCVLLPVEAVKECGLMDEERFPLGWGDAQYFMRMRKKGWRLILDPTALVWCEPNTYPLPLHTLPVRKMLNVLFLDKRHPANLQRQFIARWESAPQASLGLLAFVVYCVRLIWKTCRYGIQEILRRSDR